MKRHLVQGGGALAAAGTAAALGYLSANENAGGKHATWPYFLFGAVIAAGLILYFVGQDRTRRVPAGRQAPSVHSPSQVTEDAHSFAPPIFAEADWSHPNVARTYNYLLGGKDALSLDREQGERILSIYPRARQLVRHNRDFLERALAFVLSQGVRQFIDLGTGLPSEAFPATLEIVRERAARAAVIYVDDDEAVLVYLRALGKPSDDDQIAVIRADISDPPTVLDACRETGLIEWSRPACVILALILHFHNIEKAQQIASAYVKALAAGSFMILTVTCAEPRIGQRLTSAYEAASFRNHTADEVTGLFTGLQLIGPGVVDAVDWSPDQPAAAATAPPAVEVLAGVGRKL